MTFDRVKERLASLPPQTWVVLLTVGCLAPFCGRAFNIDDTLFLRAAEQIRRQPGNFYGFEVNWFGFPQPMFDAFENPPLTCYFITLVSLIAGWSEPALHLAFLLPAVAAAWGVYSLARNYCARPLFAAIATVLTPVFLISASTIMCDVMLMAFWMWSLVFFERGLQRKRTSDFWLSGALAGLAVLTKFPGLALAPLLTAYALARERCAGRWLISPALPLLFAAGYEWLTHELYGRGLLSSSATYASNIRQVLQQTTPGNSVIGLGFAGGCFLPILFYAPFLWSRRFLVPAAGALLVCLLLSSHFDRYRALIHRADGALNLGLWLQMVLFLFAGLHLLLLIVVDAWERRDAVSLMLVLWALGIFVFAVGVNWSVNARSLLPMTGALGILVARRLEQSLEKTGAQIPWRLVLPAVAGGCLSLMLLKADFDFAGTTRRAAEEAWAKYHVPERTVWFQGHWGFQYYLEKLGARAVDLKRPAVKPGDIIIVPNHLSNVVPLNPGDVATLGLLEYPSGPGFFTMNPSVGAGFFASVIGPLPFAFGRGESQIVGVFRAKGRDELP